MEKIISRKIRENPLINASKLASDVKEEYLNITASESTIRGVINYRRESITAVELAEENHW